MKKLFFTLLLTTTALITIACSKPSPQEDSQVKQKEILQKVIENHNNLKSISLNIETENKDGLTKSNVSANKEPLFVKIHNETNKGTSYQQYVDNNYIYFSDDYSTNKPTSLVWSKSKATDSDKWVINKYLNDSNLLFFNNSSQYSLTTSETDTTYEFTFDVSNPDNWTDPYTNESYKKYTVKYIFDKNSLYIKSSEVNSITESGATEKIKTTYLDYNVEFDTKLPKETTSAKEVENKEN